MTQHAMSTAFAKFYKAHGGEGPRYYPVTPESRAPAREYDVSGDPPQVEGFGVYDTAISTDYAIAIYSTEAEASAHKASEPEQSPRASLFEKGTDKQPEPSKKRKTSRGTR